MNYLNLLIVAKTVPIHRINRNLSLFDNHSSFIVQVWILLIILSFLVLTCCGSPKDTDEQFNLIHYAYLGIILSIIPLSIILTLDVPFVHTSAVYIDTKIQLNSQKIPYERSEVKLYKLDKSNLVAKKELSHTQSSLNKRIRYDNNHIKDIHAPMINHKLYIVSPHSRLYHFAHTSYNPDHNSRN